MGIIPVGLKVGRVSFSDYWNVLLLLAGAVNLFALTVSVLNWQIAEILANAIEQFQKVSKFVSLILVEWWLNVPVPQSLRDMLLLYLIVGGVTLRTRSVINKLNAGQPWRKNPDFMPPRDLFTRTQEELQRRRNKKNRHKVEQVKSIAARAGIADKSTDVRDSESAPIRRGIFARIWRKAEFWLGVVAAHLLVVLLVVFLPVKILFDLLAWPRYAYRRWNVQLLHLTGDPREEEVPDYGHPDYDLAIAKLRFKYVFITQLVIIMCADLIFLALS